MRGWGCVWGCVSVGLGVVGGVGRSAGVAAVWRENGGAKIWQAIRSISVWVRVARGPRMRQRTALDVAQHDSEGDDGPRVSPRLEDEGGAALGRAHVQMRVGPRRAQSRLAPMQGDLGGEDRRGDACAAGARAA